jgi:NAD(P)H-quinone oxidoreductase subunit 4L
MLRLLLLVAAALFCVGLYGVLSQRQIVMIMMGLELMLGGVIVAAGTFWRFAAPDGTGQVLVVVVLVAMAAEMAMGFAIVTAAFRTSKVEAVEEAQELRE